MTWTQRNRKPKAVTFGVGDGWITLEVATTYPRRCAFDIVGVGSDGEAVELRLTRKYARAVGRWLLKYADWADEKLERMRKEG